MQRKKGASFRDFFSFLRSYGLFYPAEMLFTLRDTTLYIRFTGMFLRGKGRKCLTSFLTSPRERYFHNVNFSNCLCSISTVKRVTQQLHKKIIFCNKKKSRRFSALFYECVRLAAMALACV